MVRKATNRKKSNQKKAQRQKARFKFSVEVIGVILTFFSVLGGLRLGYIGRLLSNLFRFMVGNTDQVLFVLFALYGLFLIIKGKELTLQKRYFLGGILAYSTTLLLLHTLTFTPYAPPIEGIVNETIQRFVIDFQSNQITANLGGGMIGAVMYTATRFLIAQIGTVLLIGLLYIATTLILLDIPFSDVIDRVRQWGGKFKQAKVAKQESKIEKNEQKSQVRSEEKQLNGDGLLLRKETKQPQKMSFVERMKHLVFDAEEEIEPTRNEHSHAQEPKQPTDQMNHSVTDAEIRSVDGIQQDELIQANDPIQHVSHMQLDDEHDVDIPMELDMTNATDDPEYQLPPITLLNPVTQNDQSSERDIVKRNVQILEDTFKSFGVDAKVIDEPLLGPAVTKFEIKPAVGVKVSKIVNLSDDIALALAAKDIRIEAPIPGKPYIGIEVPNSKTSFISFSDVIQMSLQSDHVLDVPLGRDISGQVRLADLTKMPHMLIAGSTGSGKSVCINGIITSILMKAKPNEVKLMMIDPKMVELNVYNGIPHLLTPVVTNPRKAAQALQKVVAEMEKRYEMFAAMGMRNIDGYNAHVAQYNLETGEDNPLLPYIVVIVDELADLMMVASNEVEDAIIRLAQMARAAGIHMVLATQRPSVDVITGIIKANVPSRIAFAVSSGTDSRTIIDASGAEKLLGRGDMLYMPMGENKPIRVQGAYLTDAEVERVVEFVKNQKEAEYDESMMPSDVASSQTSEPEDELFDQVIEMLQDQDTVSTSFLQRRFRIGYNRAARLIDDLEMRGYIGPADGSKPRKVNLQNLPQQFEQIENENASESVKDEHSEQID